MKQHNINTNSNSTIRRYNLKDAAKYLGLEPSYLYQLNSKNSITYYRPNNGKVYYLESDLDNWLNRNLIQSTDEVSMKYSKHKKQVRLI